ncbi:MAG: GGDEF domain-containing protein [Chloroflexota bacterium]
MARVRTQLRHAEDNLLSEFTGLPGNTQIQRALRQALRDPRRDLLVLYIDVDHFKSFNDVYGFLRGNELIKRTAAILRGLILGGDPAWFLGHIGGDDFVAILHAGEDDAEQICRTLIEQFEAQMPMLYDPSDRQRGFVVATDRQSQSHQFPLVTVSIAIVSNHRRMIADEWEASAIAAELKKAAKQQMQSVYVFDKRSSS